MALVPLGALDVKSWLIRSSALAHAVYHGANAAWHRGQLAPATAVSALKDAIYEGTRRHVASVRCTGNVYAA